MPPRVPFRKAPKKPASRPANVPMATAKPVVVAPSSATSTTRAQQRRGFSDEQRAQLIQTGKTVGKPLAVGAGIAGAGYVVGKATMGVVTEATKYREAGRPVTEGYDINNDGKDDVITITGLDGLIRVIGPDGKVIAGAASDPPPGWAEKFSETAKTVGLVVGALVVVGGVVYLATHPSSVASLRRAVGR